ncbi:major facilitator superfamily domain-containing protein [Zopfochytrium polystomum]|nr:major facilitator superfamily domain-containing protein [Zopfochytrium polystomum]
MSMTILFPFVYFMVRDFGIADEKNIGFYVGFIASSFSLAQFLTSLFWGWVSDRVGRRPVLLLGLIGNTVSLLMFGQSHSLWWAIMSRSLCGFLNGNVGVAKSLLGEITDATNQTKAFSLFGLMWSIGMICGPILGGFLANPATTYPGLFGGCPFLRANPYFLPCLLSASISMIGFTVGFFYLEETLPRLRGYTAVRTDDEIAGREEAASPGVSDCDTLSTSPNHTERRCSSGAIDRDSVATVTEYEQEFSIEDAHSAVEAHNTDAVCCRTSDGCQTEEKRLLSEASVRVITGYSLLAFLSIIFDETLSLWSVTSPSHGGLGFTSSDIGFCLSLMGCTTLVMQLVVYPYLGRFFPPLHLYQIGVSFYGIVYLGFPFISTYIAASPSSYIRRLTWPLLLLNLAIRHVCNVLAFTSVMIMVNNSSTRGNLGLVNGVSQTSAAFVRCIGPALGGIMWAWSLTNELPFPFNYWFVFLCLSILGLVTSVQSRYIPGSVGQRRDKVQTLSPSEH